ncbi:hypothetical protein HaLaN_20657 [Haematococcus lacustris]|uniref:Uncharacterized protein n=1 Tax=Haematococcus lacustris TaxID=44745 RepID=A0A699ZXU8_HAELA|nr:hypothetical protein HaLaN_20657 [Haematococcus lacustris]
MVTARCCTWQPFWTHATRCTVKLAVGPHVAPRVHLLEFIYWSVHLLERRPEPQPVAEWQQFGQWMHHMPAEAPRWRRYGTRAIV